VSETFECASETFCAASEGLITAILATYSPASASSLVFELKRMK